MMDVPHFLFQYTKAGIKGRRIKCAAAPLLVLLNHIFAPLQPDFSIKAQKEGMDKASIPSF